MREDVLTALEPFGVKILAFECRGWGRYPFPNKWAELPSWVPVPDDNIWAKRHVAKITVSDRQAKYAERLLWQSNKVKLDTRKLNRNLKWTAPPDCKVGAHGTVGRGTPFVPWNSKKHQTPRQRTQRQTRRTRQRRQGDGVLSKLARWIE